MSYQKRESIKLLTMNTQQIKNAFGLKSQPSIFVNRENAFGWANLSAQASVVILGLDQRFWVVSGRDAKTLVNQGFEYAA